LLFTPEIDTRSGVQKAKSRDGRVIDSISISKSRDIITELNKSKDIVQLIGIDECQFLMMNYLRYVII
jgi:thymidine kinase